jgi:hypothetical protein
MPSYMKIEEKIQSFVNDDDIHEYLRSEYNSYINGLDFVTADQDEDMSYNDDQNLSMSYDEFIEHSVSTIQNTMFYNNDWPLRVATEVRDGDANPIEEYLLNRMLEYGYELFCDDLIQSLQS